MYLASIQTLVKTGRVNRAVTVNKSGNIYNIANIMIFQLQFIKREKIKSHNKELKQPWMQENEPEILTKFVNFVKSLTYQNISPV